MKSYLVITTLSNDKPSIVMQFVQSITNSGGNITHIKMNRLGSECVMILMVGTGGSIAKIEAAMPLMEQKLGFSILAKRTAIAHAQNKSITYLAHVVTIDREGILNDLAQFFGGQDINIKDINAETYFANNGTLMANLSLNLEIPVTTHIPTLRDRFNLYCDALNLDAGLEPIRD